jgi:hypothetical protein
MLKRLLSTFFTLMKSDDVACRGIGLTVRFGLT